MIRILPDLRASALGLILCAASSHAQTYQVTTIAEGRAGSLPFESDLCQLYRVGTFCTADIQSLYAPGGHALAEAAASSGYQEIFAGSEVRAAALAWSTFGPGGTPEDIRASASVGVIIRWGSSSSMLPAGTPIGIRAIMPFDGELGMGIAVAGAEATVASALVVATPAGQETLFEASAALMGTGLFQTSFEATGAWAGDFAPAPVAIPGWGDGDGFRLETLDLVEFDAVLGDRFDLVFDLLAHASIPDGNDHGAIADFSNTGQYTLEAFDLATGDPLDVTFEQVACYPDCDSAPGGPFTLDLFDFLCFQNAFALGEGYADCDASGILDLFDFLCFQNEFAAGCP